MKLETFIDLLASLQSKERKVSSELATSGKLSSLNAAYSFENGRGSSVLKFYDSYLERNSSQDDLTDPSRDIILHFAAMQRDLEDAAPGRRKPLALFVGKDDAAWHRLSQEVAFLTTGFVELGFRGRLRAAGVSRRPELPSPHSWWKTGLSDDVVAEISDDHITHMIVILGDQSPEKLTGFLQTLTPLANKNTLLLIESSASFEQQLRDAIASGNQNARQSQSVQTQHGSIFSVDAYFDTGDAADVDLSINPSMKPVPADQRDHHYYPIRSVKELKPIELSALGALGASQTDSYVSVRSEFIHTAKRPAQFLAGADASMIKGLTNPEFLVKELTLSALYGARFTGAGLVLTKDDALFEESFLPAIEHDEYTTWGYNYPLTAEKSRFFGFLDTRFVVSGDVGLFRPRKVPAKVKRIEGTVLLVGALYHHVYSHWLIDVLSKLWAHSIIEQQGLQDVTIAISGPLSAKQRDMLRYIGVNLDRVVEIGLEQWFEADLLLIPSRPARMYDFIAPEVFALYDKMSERALAEEAVDVSKFPKKVYAARQARAGRRRLLNEEDVVRVLDRHGCRPIEFAHLTVAEEIALFRNVDLVAAPHGSALGGMAFMSPGSKVCFFVYGELLRVIRHHYTITAHRDIELLGVLGEAFTMRADLSPWVVDETLIEEALERLS